MIFMTLITLVWANRSNVQAPLCLKMPSMPPLTPCSTQSLYNMYSCFMPVQPKICCKVISIKLLVGLQVCPKALTVPLKFSSNSAPLESFSGWDLKCLTFKIPCWNWCSIFSNHVFIIISINFTSCSKSGSAAALLFGWMCNIVLPSSTKKAAAQMLSEAQCVSPPLGIRKWKTTPKGINLLQLSQCPNSIAMDGWRRIWASPDWKIM